VGFLQCNLRNSPRTLRELSYKQFILPILEYASTIWDPYHQNNINKLKMIQHRAAYFVLHHPWIKSTRDSISSMLQSLGWPTLQLCRKCPRLILMYKLLQNLLTIPSSYVSSVTITSYYDEIKP